MGALSYADDIVLIAPTKVALRKMMTACTEYTEEYHVKFNPTKSKLLVFGNKSCSENFCFQGSVINCLTHDKYLGRLLTSGITR